MSKIIKLPELRVGYVVMSKELENQYLAIRSPQPDVVARSIMIANEVLNPDVLKPYLKTVCRKTSMIKTELLRRLDEIFIKHSPTNLNTPVLLIDGGHREFFKDLSLESVKTAPGEEFYPKDYWLNYWDPPKDETWVDPTGRYVRITIPETFEEVIDLIERICMAAHGMSTEDFKRHHPLT